MTTGGCQCGAVRYNVKSFGRASICHCRMCQKAFGNYFAPLVVVKDIEWLGDERKLFASSNKSNRGFCGKCGTPLTLEDTIEAGGNVELAIGTLDDPSQVQPDYHSNIADRLEISTRLHELPEATPSQKHENDEWNASIISHQHPDHPTDPKETAK